MQLVYFALTLDFSLYKADTTFGGPVIDVIMTRMQLSWNATNGEPLLSVV